MVKIGLNHSTWSFVVNNADSSTQSIPEGKKIELEKNNLTPFKQLFVLQEIAIKEVLSYKETSKMYSEKMRSVAEKIVEEDESAKNSFINNVNIKKTRFN